MFISTWRLHHILSYEMEMITIGLTFRIGIIRPGGNSGRQWEAKCLL